jgi:pantoate--beta-alanine ligase
MRTVRTIADLRRALVPARDARMRVGLVATMGALHGGHLALLGAARADCDLVVMSLFVNPAQFGPSEDLAAYPRDEARDAALAQEAGVDLLFAPAVEEIYPPGFATTVLVRGVSERLEGARRPGHFEGVATVVTKLLNIVGPDVAYFGQKDAQQALVIKRLVSDLAIPVQIVVCPTVREPDGLALSSRNAYLDGGQRAQAVGLSRALSRAASLIAAGERSSVAAVLAARAELAAHGLNADYLEIVDPLSLEPVAEVEQEVLVAVAAKVGSTALIDNVIATPNRNGATRA